MLENYLERNIISLEDLKDYLFQIDDNYSLEVERLFLKKQVIDRVNKHKDYYFDLAMQALMKAKGVQNMEYHLLMMNYFFKDDLNFEKLKIELKPVLLKCLKPLESYRLLRYFIKLPRQKLIEEMYHKKYLTTRQAAYLFIVEGFLKEAYDYLYQCEKDTKLIDYYASFDMKGALSLLKHYDEKGEELCITPMMSINSFNHMNLLPQNK